MLVCQQSEHRFAVLNFYLVGMTGFEPAASSSRTKRATKLCYIPTTTNYTPANTI